MITPADRIRVIFDCNTLVQAIAFERSSAAACLRLVEDGTIDRFISKPMLKEWQRVLAYPAIAALSENMLPTRIEAFLQRLLYRATLVRRVRHIIDYPRDPTDEPYLDLALVIKAHYLISRDNDLLILMSGHSALCKQFRRRAGFLHILDPERFLEAIRSRTSAK